MRDAIHHRTQEAYLFRGSYGERYAAWFALICLPLSLVCLLIKKSVINYLQNPSGKKSSGIVKITPDYALYLSDSMDDLEGEDVFDTDMDHEIGSDRDKTSIVFEDVDSISVHELIKSLVFSEDKSSDTFSD